MTLEKKFIRVVLGLFCLLLLNLSATEAAEFVGNWEYRVSNLADENIGMAALKNLSSSDDWQVLAPLEHPKLKPNTDVVFLRTTLRSTNAQKNVLMFMTTNQAVRVWLKDHLIYEKGDFTKGSYDEGMQLHLITLPTFYSRAQLVVEVYSDYSRHLGVLDKVKIDTEVNQIQRMFYSDVPVVLASPVVAIIIVIMLCFYWFFRRAWRRLYGYIMLFMAILGIWLFCTSIVKNMFLGHTVLWWYILGMMAYLLPLAANLILYELLKKYPYSRMKYIIVIDGSMFFIAMVGEILGYHTMNGLMNYYYPILAITEGTAFYWCLRAAKKGDILCRAVMVPTATFTILGIFDGLSSHYNIFPWRIYMTPLGIYAMMYFVLVILREQLRRERKLTAQTIGLEQESVMLHQASTIDVLTGCLNRSQLNKRLATAIADAKHTKRNFAALLLDIDHFKNFNDKYGHEVGDKVLQGFANVIRHKLPPNYPFIRWGGEEFFVIIDDDDMLAVVDLAENLRQTVAETPLDGMTITCSIGITAWRGNNDKPEALFKRVDNALYVAKNNGRNQVQVC